MPGELEHSTGANVAVLHSIPELRIAEDHAMTLGEAETLRLLKCRRLVLLVDLDQTLIHTTTDDVDRNVKVCFLEF